MQVMLYILILCLYVLMGVAVQGKFKKYIRYEDFDELFSVACILIAGIVVTLLLMAVTQ